MDSFIILSHGPLQRLTELLNSVRRVIASFALIPRWYTNITNIKRNTHVRPVTIYRTYMCVFSLKGSITPRLRINHISYIWPAVEGSECQQNRQDHLLGGTMNSRLKKMVRITQNLT